MAGARMLATMVLVGGALGASAGAAAQSPVYTRAATRSCLTRLPHTVSGLPPATPPTKPALFVYALAHDDMSTWTLGRRPRAHKQLGVWSGDRKSYDGVILSFFESVRDARASVKTLASLDGGKRIGNVVATWDAKRPSRPVREAVFGCLRPGPGSPAGSSGASPPASLATFAGRWGGHTRGLSISSTARGREMADDGCCTRVYQMRFRILSVRGTLTRATAVYRITSFKRYRSGVRKLRVGEGGRLLLRNGIVKNTLTRDWFCSDPAWGATGACGA